MDVDGALALERAATWPAGSDLDEALTVLAAEVRRLREVLDGAAPAEGSWQTEALALRAELDKRDAAIQRMRELLGDEPEMTRFFDSIDELIGDRLDGAWLLAPALLRELEHALGGETS
jgi:hypothetical protein